MALAMDEDEEHTQWFDAVEDEFPSDEEHTPWMDVMEEAAQPVGVASNHACNPGDRLRSRRARHVPGAVRQLAEDAGTCALMPEQLRSASNGNSSSDSGSGSGTTAVGATVFAEHDKTERTMQAHLLNALFISDLTADLVGWQPHPTERLAEIATESPLLSALTQQGMHSGRVLPRAAARGLTRAGPNAACALQRYRALSRPQAQKVGQEVLPGLADARPGMHIKYAFFDGAAKRHGVVNGDGRVVEVVNRMFPRGEGGSGGDNMRSSVQSLVMTSTTDEFWQRAKENGSEVVRVVYASDPSLEEVAERAHMSLGRWNYHAVFNNCEHVSTLIATGAYASEQCDRFMQTRGAIKRKRQRSE
jgi:hypothetical protein